MRLLMSGIAIMLMVLAPVSGLTAESESILLNRITMMDLGSQTCLPCKMMVPILAKLQADYKDKADIIFVDVEKNRQEAAKYRIKLIPTQIFFTSKGREIYRHEGFLSEDAARKMLDILLE
jgi:thioredoxin 1